MFNKKIIAAAIAVAGMGATQAFAALGVAPQENQFRISGATAFDGLLLETFVADTANNPCVIDNNYELYLATDTANPGHLDENNFAVTCTLRAGSDFETTMAPFGVAAGETVEFYKASTGSGDGVRPFDSSAAPIGVRFLDPTAVGQGDDGTNNANCNTANLAADDPVLPNGAQTFRCANLPGQAPLVDRSNGLTLGTSDVEPALFGVSLPAANGPSLTWGVPVSIDLRDALQAFQFPVGSECHPANVGVDNVENANPANVTPDGLADAAGFYNSQATHPNGDLMVDLNGVPVMNRESEACQPSITREMMGDIFTGNLFDWNLVVNAQGQSLVQVANSFGLGPRSGNSAVFLCRRREGSGTEASYEAIFLRQRCQSGSFAPAGMANPFGGVLSPGADPFQLGVSCPGFNNAGNVTSDTDVDGDNIGCGLPAGPLFNAGTRVFAGRGTGDVRECLTLHSQGDAYLRTSRIDNPATVSVDNIPLGTPNAAKAVDTSLNGDGTWALGIFSTENIPNDGNEGGVGELTTGVINPSVRYPNRRYRHIKINDYIGSTLNVAQGLYPYFSEISMQTHTTAEGNGAQAAAAFRVAVRDSLARTLADPGLLAVLNGNQIWGNAGSLAAMDTVGRLYESQVTVGFDDGSVDYPLTGPSVAALPLVPRSKHLTGSVNNCQEPFHMGGFQSIAAPMPTNSNATTAAQVPNP